MVEQIAKKVKKTRFFHSSLWFNWNAQIKIIIAPKQWTEDWWNEWKIEKKTSRIIIENKERIRILEKIEEQFIKQIERIITR